jgi:hypothetical protein
MVGFTGVISRPVGMLVREPGAVRSGVRAAGTEAMRMVVSMHREVQHRRQHGAEQEHEQQQLRRVLTQGGELCAPRTHASHTVAGDERDCPSECARERDWFSSQENLGRRI